ncbi:hypothetical protein L0Y40_03230 [Candidatus Wolfebacteria bacterium]|nr:hypothetical protein [Candidatus Wolfebacteria bacterium]
MKVSKNILKEIAESTLEKIKNTPKENLSKILNMTDYHGFLKSRLPESFLGNILSPFKLTPEDVQIEVVEVNTDLAHEVHYHQHAFAYCVIMGSDYNIIDARHAKAYLQGNWFPVSAGNVLEIPPGTHHGFTIDPGGTLTFLSVQAPPIVGGGHDDYHRIN